jgi:hypothetical protein
VHDLVPYLKDTEPHHWGHTIEHLAFESDEEGFKVSQKEEMIKKLKWGKQPLDQQHAHVSNLHILLPK